MISRNYFIDVTNKHKHQQNQATSEHACIHHVIFKTVPNTNENSTTRTPFYFLLQYIFLPVQSMLQPPTQQSCPVQVSFQR